MKSKLVREVFLTKQYCIIKSFQRSIRSKTFIKRVNDSMGAKALFVNPKK